MTSPRKPSQTKPLKTDPPDSLQRRGLIRVTTNLVDGEEILIPVRKLVELFGPEIRIRLEQRRSKNHDR